MVFVPVLVPKVPPGATSRHRAHSMSVPVSQPPPPCSLQEVGGAWGIVGGRRHVQYKEQVRKRMNGVRGIVRKRHRKAPSKLRRSTPAKNWKENPPMPGKVCERGETR